MPTIGSMTKTIRFNPEDLGKIESLMRKEDTSFNNAVHLLINDTGTPQRNEDFESIGEMASLMRVTTEKLLSDIREMIENGELYYMNGKLRNPYFAELEDICERKKIDIESLLAKVVRDVENGK